MVVLGGLDSGDLSGGLADDVLGESLGLSVPLGYRVAVSDPLRFLHHADH